MSLFAFSPPAPRLCFRRLAFAVRMAICPRGGCRQRQPVWQARRCVCSGEGPCLPCLPVLCQKFFHVCFIVLMRRRHQMMRTSCHVTWCSAAYATPRQPVFQRTNEESTAHPERTCVGGQCRYVGEGDESMAPPQQRWYGCRFEIEQHRHSPAGSIATRRLACSES